LNHCRFTDKGLAHLKTLDHLERLSMFRTKVDDTGAAQLAEFKSLRAINFDYTKLTDKGIDLLKMLPHLEELGLDSTEVDDHGADLLASISTLKSLDLYHTLVSDNGYRVIKSALPQCQIFWDKDSSLTSRRKL
jgi:hypothetical protein